ncbi:MAG: DEAD/DEAH box helicase, partial [Erysipelotrichaceae bacterium]|nr:DEAD/DEAH box helicase [Erysipelotrichaceae bacterium]
MNFNEFELKEELLRAIIDSHYESPTEIQEKSLPILLTGKDLIGQAATGTGKTASFVLPMLQRIEPTPYKDTKALILTPTRELAQQITEEIRKFAKYMEGIRTCVLYGGVPINKQITELKKGADIIVACPGRLIDHLNRHTIDLDYVDYLVLDEADEMLNMGFKEDIDIILQHIQEERQTMLFSATMPQAILDLTNSYLKEPVTIKIQTKEITATTVKQVGYECAQQHKKALLMQLLDLLEPELT